MAAARRGLLAAFLATAGRGEETVGCFFHPFAAPTIGNPYNDAVYIYHDDNVTAWETASSAVDCQERCFNQTNCSVFTFYADTRGCWLQGADAKLEISPNGDKYGAGTVAGPKVCPAVPDRCGPLSVPRPGFPETESQAWPENYQPRKLVCWKADRSTLEPKFDACRNATTLQAVRDCTWERPGLPVPPFKSCRQVCEEEPQCAAYEERNGLCYTGLGFNCSVLPASTPNATGARLGRGRVRTVYEWAEKEFVAGEVTLLGWGQKQFFAKVFGNSSFPTLSEARTACREVCVSSITCEFWQLSATEGCFVDTTDAYFQLAYPLTAAHFSGSTKADIVAGEYLQHLCGVPESNSNPWAVGTTAAPVHDARGVAHINLDALNLDYTHLPVDKLPTLIDLFQREIAAAVGVAPAQVTVGLTRGTSAIAARRLQSGTAVVTTVVHADVQVPPGRTAEEIEAGVASNQALFDRLAQGTKTMLGEASPAIVGPLTFRAGSAPPSGVRGRSGLPWWVWLLIALGALLLVSCILAVGLGACSEKKRKSKSSRRKKQAVSAQDEVLAAVEEPLAPVPTVAQPVPMYVSGPGYAQAQSPVVYVSGTAAQPIFVSGASPVAFPTTPIAQQPVYITNAAAVRTVV